MPQDPKNLHPVVKIMLAETEVERDAARAALHRANAQAPTDRQVIGEFLKDCTTMDGESLTLNDAGEVSVGAPEEAAPTAARPRYDSAKPFFVKGREYAAIQDAVDAAAAASLLAENNFTADITQLLQLGVYGYAGSAIPFAHFRNGADLDALAADEDGVPDLGRRARAFVATSNQPTQHHMTDMTIPAKARDYLQFKRENKLLIQAISGGIGPLPDEAHDELHDEMKDVIGADAANAAGDDSDDQDLAVQRGESWVSANCADGDLFEDVAIALWIKGTEGGGKYLREAWGTAGAKFLAALSGATGKSLEVLQEAGYQHSVSGYIREGKTVQMVANGIASAEKHTRHNLARLASEGGVAVPTVAQSARIAELDAEIDLAVGLHDSAFFDAVAAKDEYLEEQGISRRQIETTGREPRTAFEALCQQTNTVAADWELTNGPETGVGFERRYLHKGDAREAYTVDDQGVFTVEVSEPSQERVRPTGA